MSGLESSELQRSSRSFTYPDGPVGHKGSNPIEHRAGEISSGVPMVFVGSSRASVVGVTTITDPCPRAPYHCSPRASDRKAMSPSPSATS